MREELPKHLQRLWADMVLDPLGVFFRHLPPHTEREEEIQHKAVTLAGAGCESAAFLRKEDGAVGLARRKTVPNKALHGADDGGRTDAEALGQICRTCLAARRDEIVDHLDIVLGEL